jgi:Bacterial protein of unknown function (DUF899)
MDADGRPTRSETLLTVTFADLGGRTGLTLNQAVFESVTARDDYRRGGAARSANSLNILGQSKRIRTLPKGELSMEHRIATRDEWLAARKLLLTKEKEHTRVSDELNRQRRELPWVRVEKEYVFDAPTGKITLALEAVRKRRAGASRGFHPTTAISI